MKTLFLALAVVASATHADAPAPASPMDRLMAALPGTWHTVGQTFDTQFTKAGAQNYTTLRDCWRDKDSVKCVFVVNGSLQLYDIFSYDTQDGLYHETQVTPQGKQPEFHISVKDPVWTYDQDIASRDGGVIHYRIVRTYRSPLSVDYSYAFSTDGKQWTEIAKGTESKNP